VFIWNLFLYHFNVETATTINKGGISSLKVLTKVFLQTDAYFWGSFLYLCLITPALLELVPSSGALPKQLSQLKRAYLFLWVLMTEAKPASET
jgi:hypothetical protein